MSAAASVLSQQSEKIEVFDEMKDDIGPTALDQRMEAFKQGTEDRWKHLDEEVRTALHAALS